MFILLVILFSDAELMLCQVEIVRFPFMDMYNNHTRITFFVKIASIILKYRSRILYIGLQLTI